MHDVVDLIMFNTFINKSSVILMEIYKKGHYFNNKEVLLNVHGLAVRFFVYRLKNCKRHIILCVLAP